MNRGVKPLLQLRRQQFWYFQFRDLPSAVHSIVVSTRCSRVSGRLASVIHSMYSRRQLGLKLAQAAAAFLLRCKAAVRSAGSGRGGRGLALGRVAVPESCSATAFLI